MLLSTSALRFSAVLARDKRRELQRAAEAEPLKATMTSLCTAYIGQLATLSGPQSLSACSAGRVQAR